MDVSASAGLASMVVVVVARVVLGRVLVVDMVVLDGFGVSGITIVVVSDVWDAVGSMP